MAITFDALKQLVEAAELKYFVAPDRPVIMLGFQGLLSQVQLVISLEDQGEFLQFRTIHFLECPAGHPNLGEVLKAIGHLNYSRRLVKFAWDPSDGEIVMYADMWLVDSAPSRGQFRRMVQSFFGSADLGHGRLKLTIDTGKDPGELEPQELLRLLSGSDSPLSGLLKSLLGKLSPKGPARPGPDFGTI